MKCMHGWYNKFDSEAEDKAKFRNIKHIPYHPTN